MAEALALGPGTFTIGSDSGAKQFAGRCTEITLKPDIKEGDVIHFLDGTSDTESDDLGATIEGKMQQTLDAAALEYWTWEQTGKIMPFTFIPVNGKGKKITGQLKVAAVEIGGDVKKKNETSFKFRVIGWPTIAAVG